MNGLPDGLSCDAFHRGRFHLVQPVKSSHRAGLDAMLLAACVNGEGAFAVADFGAGAGAAGFAVAARCDAARVTLVENHPAMVDCAAQTLALPSNAALAQRIQLHQGDVADFTQAPDHYDWVIMNPPFNDAADQRTPHDAKAHAHVLSDGLFDLWLKKAAGTLHAKGAVALIARPQSLHSILTACEKRFGGLRVTPVQPHTSRDAIRVLVTGHKGSRKPLAISQPLVLHASTDSHAFTAHADALINGQAALPSP